MRRHLPVPAATLATFATLMSASTRAENAGSSPILLPSRDR